MTHSYRKAGEEMKEKALIWIMLVLFHAIVAITISKASKMGGVGEFMKGKCMEQLAEIEAKPAETWTKQDIVNRNHIIEYYRVQR